MKDLNKMKKGELIAIINEANHILSTTIKDSDKFATEHREKTGCDVAGKAYFELGFLSGGIKTALSVLN